MAATKGWGYQRWDDEQNLDQPTSSPYSQTAESPYSSGATSSNADPWTPSWAQNGANAPGPAGQRTPTTTSPTGTGVTREQTQGWYDKYLGRPMDEAGWATHAANPYGAQGVETAIKDSKEAKGYQAAQTYKSALANLSSITDPAKRTAEADKLARQVFTDLQAAGHDVKWSGQNLIIDGREYEFAVPTAAAGAGTGTGSTFTPSWAANNGVGLEGFDLTRAQDPSFSAKDSFAKAWQRAGGPPPGLDKEALVGWFNQYIKPSMEADGHRINWVDKDMMNFTSPQGTFTVDWYRGAGAEGGAGAWQVQGQAGANGAAGAGTAGVTTPAAGTAGTAGVTTGTNYGTGTTPTTAPSTTGTSNTAAGFTPSAPEYDAQQMDPSSIPDTSQLGAQLPNYIPTPVEVGDLSAGPIDAATEQLLAQLLANPYSLDDQTIASMKAADKDTAANAYTQDAQDLEMAAGRLGITDSPWLAAEQARAKRGRDTTMWEGARNIDIEAAKTRTGDQRAAIGLGTTFANNKATQKLNAETLKANVAQQNQSNLFQAADLKTRQVMGVVDANLREAALRKDVHAMNEQVKQAATELGLSRDKLVADWAATVLDDSTRKYLGELGYAIDSRKLDQSSREFDADYALRAVMFAENLKLEYAQLSQNDRQFGSSLGLQTGVAQNNATNSAIDAYLRSRGL